MCNWVTTWATLSKNKCMLVCWTMETRQVFAAVDVIGWPPTSDWVYQQLTAWKKHFLNPLRLFIRLRTCDLDAPRSRASWMATSTSFSIRRLVKSDWRDFDGTSSNCRTKKWTQQFRGGLLQTRWPTMWSVTGIVQEGIDLMVRRDS